MKTWTFCYTVTIYLGIFENREFLWRPLNLFLNHVKNKHSITDLLIKQHSWTYWATCDQKPEYFVPFLANSTLKAQTVHLRKPSTGARGCTRAHLWRGAGALGGQIILSAPTRWGLSNSPADFGVCCIYRDRRCSSVSFPNHNTDPLKVIINKSCVYPGAYA